MKSRVQRFYYEELEEIIENLYDKIDEINNTENLSEYEKDKVVALARLALNLDLLEVNKNEKVY